VTLVDVVKSDLEWLVREFEDGSRERDELRRASAVVRRLLVDGSLQQARKMAGAQGQPKMDVYPLSQALDLTHLADVELVVAAGCRIERRLLGPFSMGPQHFSMPSPPVVDSLPLPQFMGSPCLVAKGQFVSRNQVVKYIANKLGGVHYDTSRLRKSDEYIQQLQALDGYMVVKPISAVDLTLLAIIQAMISSESVMNPFRLQQISLNLNVPLEHGNHSIEMLRRARLKVDLMGDDPA